MMNTQKTAVMALSALMLISTAGSAFAFDRHDGFRGGTMRERGMIEQRDQQNTNWITQGVERGKISGREKSSLNEKQRDIRQLEANAFRDNRLTASEIGDIRNKQDQLTASIRKERWDNNNHRR